MKNLKEKNIQKVIWHMQRQFGRLAETSDAAAMKNELFYLQASMIKIHIQELILTKFFSLSNILKD